jgi:cyclophilin family peptidyl-prolyl cis-trans isomerase
MNTTFKKFLFLPLIFIVFACKSQQGNENTFVLMKTTLGDIKLKLYDNTPVHRDNFIKLVNSGFYDGISFHRVIRDFMIQAGDPLTKSGSSAALPDSLQTYTIPAEFNPADFHKRGALAAAREGNDINPEMRSSGTQFYIVQGVKLNDSELDQAQKRINSNIKQAEFSRLMKETADSAKINGKDLSDAEIQELASVKMFDYLTSHKDYTIPAEHREIYKTIGGVPRLDCTYTVFGEVVSGMDVVDRIADVSTDSNDKPLEDVKILKAKITKN